VPDDLVPVQGEEGAAGATGAVPVTDEVQQDDRTVTT
jgi:hypothetical protein